MSTFIKQACVMIHANIFSLRRRLAISVSMALSISLVVCVLAGFLAMAKGFEVALTGAGSPMVAVILGGGTNQEAGSDIPADAIRTLYAMTDDIGVSRESTGSLISSREIVVPVDVKQFVDGTTRTLALRGMDADGPSIREGITLSQGRFFTSGAREIVVGDRLAAEFGLGVGDTVRLGAVDWTVTGHFSAHGSAFESEIWADLDAVRAAFERQGQIQSLRLRLTSSASLKVLQDKLATITAIPLVAVSEADLYAAQSGRTANLIRLFGWPVALLMAVGATAGALNTMMSSVSDRTVEIATVRALGFGRLSAFIGTWVEAVILASAGAVLGIIASWLIFNGWQASTVGVNNARMAFQLAVTPSVMLTAGLLGLAIGIIGGALPAIAATRLPLTAALRARG
ncbi:ABC transporter permease [Neorhizobium lilium]|uniref:ABC transporter permease n=1 Tax=Neorhizobium lilium TaxID=2503024 RepID=A0A444LLF0_9HYPH|nr:ABC transporter permease [Neorhizobium lilium]RWX81108.1 ABC transporter permease [Neorhizobium lilium]